MALAATGIFELRPDGSSNQSGFFNPALGGTDYSQQAVAQVIVTDGVTNGTTTITSATANFTSQMLGNGITVALDNYYEIRAVVSATQITVDRATLNGGAGRTLLVGGASTLANNTGLFPAVFNGVLAAGHKQYVRATTSAGVPTTYAMTPAGQPGLTVSGSAANPITTEGYSTVRGDGGRPTINIPGWSLNVSGAYHIVRNLQVATVSGSQNVINLTGVQCHLENLVLDPGLSSGAALSQSANNCIVRRVYGKPNHDSGGGTVSIFDLTGTGCLYEYCDISGSAAFNGATINNPAVFRGCIFRDNHLAGVKQNNVGGAGPCQFLNCVFWNNGTDGLLIQRSDIAIMGWDVENSIFGQNGGYDLNYTPADLSANTGAIEWAKAQLRCNWFFTTGTGRYHQLPAGADDHALTANPFSSSATGDFSLNSLAGGGALITNGPCTTTFADGLNTSLSLAGFAGLLPTSSDTATMRSIWREITNERSSLVVPDATVDIYLDSGLQEINRQAHYYFVTDPSSLTLTAGVQEMTLPENVIEIQWVRWGSQRNLEKGDIEQWRRRADDWQNEPAGIPQYWAHYGNQLVIRPTPSAAAVAGSAALTFRYYGVPPSLDNSGPVQADQQMQRLAVWYGVYAWSAAYPDSAVAAQRGAAYKAMFDEGMAKVVEQYSRKGISR